MTDCVETLHGILNNPDELRRAQADFATAWAKAMIKTVKPRPEPFKATGEAMQRVNPVARRVLLITEQNWSGK